MPISIVLSHAEQDKNAAIALERHLTPLQRTGKIALWHRGTKDDQAGKSVNECIDRMQTAQIIILLISPDLEMDREADITAALAQRERGARVIPVLWRAVDLGDVRYNNLRMLPDGQPVEARTNRDQIWVEVVQGIRRVVEHFEKQGITGPVAAPEVATGPVAGVAAEVAPPAHPGAAAPVQQSAAAPAPAAAPSVLKILFFTASPTGTTRQRLDQEVKSIGNRLHASKKRARIELVQAWAATAAELSQTLLQHEPTIVHFSGECTPTGELLLEDETGAPSSVSSDVLAKLFRILVRRGVRCVVLNARDSAIPAQAIAKYVDCVIGLTDKPSDQAAIAFAVGFYTGLATGETLQAAFELGGIQIGAEKQQGEALFQIVAREKVDLETVRLL